MWMPDRRKASKAKHSKGIRSGASSMRAYIKRRPESAPSRRWRPSVKSSRRSAPRRPASRDARMLVVEAEDGDDSGSVLAGRLLAIVEGSRPEIRWGGLGVVKVDVATARFQVLRDAVANRPAGALPLASAEIDRADSAV